MKKYTMLAMVCLLVACSPSIAGETSTESEELTIENITALVSRTELVEDLWHIVDILNTNFAMLDALERVYGRIAQDLATHTYNTLPLHDYFTHESAVGLLNQFVHRLSAGYVGHLNIFLNERDEYGEIVPEMMRGEWDFAYFWDESRTESNVIFAPSGSNYQELSQVHGIAYVRVPVFFLEYMYTNVALMQAFLETIADKDYLIVDLTRHGGMFSVVWYLMFVATLWDSSADYFELLPLFFKASDTVLEQIEEFGFVYHEIELFDGLNFPELVWGDLKNLDIFIDFAYPSNRQRLIDAKAELLEVAQDLGIEPVDFEGEIFLLIDERTWSAADTATRWARAHNWATIVGTPTPGIGGSSGAGFQFVEEFPLLHVDASIRVDLEYAINDVGRWNEEQGTLPDIWQADGMSILGTAIDHIINRGASHD